MALLWLLMALLATPSTTARPIRINDNRQASGRHDGAELAIRLIAGTGLWRPNGADGPPLEVAAFGEEGGELSVPGPLIRVREGTTVLLTVRNALGSDLRVFGLCARPGPCEPMPLGAGATREVRFALNTPGTYFYWASSSAQTLTARSRNDSQLGGVIVVDPRGAAIADRIMVISAFEEGRAIGQCAGGADTAVFAINGESWPHTTRLRYDAGDTVRWRIVNLSCEQHAMHLHGFHFDVDAAGDGVTDRQLSAEQRRTVVTESIQPGSTFAMSWVPVRAGNWLFHCHMIVHMTPPSASMHAEHGDGRNATGMAGLVIGIEIADRDPTRAAPVSSGTTPARRFSLVLREEPNRYGDKRGYRMDLEGTDAPRLHPGPVPGPVLVLERGEPAEITVVNRMAEPTAIHWHGIEVESYFDGVPGFGGMGTNISPPVAPGRSFVAKLTPPRAGTFIYHTHWHDESQLAGGLYGPLIVLEPGDHYDPDTDDVVVIGLNGVLTQGQREPFALNGRAKPSTIRMKAGVPHRLRLINITANNTALTASLVNQLEPIEWKPVAKDGVTLPAAQTAPRAARQQVAVGETYDFQIHPERPQNLWLEVRRGNGEWVLQAPILVR
jgi:FtsP/CotA-like multicopper oxidase with cupredoxin domain